MDRQIDRQHSWMDKQMDGEVERWTYIRIDRQTERYEDGKTNGWIDR
jgi:hypothetical protein